MPSPISSRRKITRVVAVFAGAFILAGTARAQDVLLIPDSGRDTVIALSPIDGSVINASFLTDTALSTPIEIVDSGRGTLFLSDQLLSEVREYSRSGQFLGTVAGSAQGLNNIRGVAVRDGFLYVANSGGTTFASQVVRMNLANTGAGFSTFANLGAVTAGASPWDLLFRNNDLLVTDSTGDDVLQFDLNGNFVSTLVNGANAGPINFPQQMTTLANGNLLVSGFSLPTALYEFNSTTGSLVNTFTTNTGNRGVYELQNGLILYTAGTQVRTYNRTTNTSQILIDNLSPASNFRFITRVNLSASAAAPEPASLGLVALAGVAAIIVRRRRK